MVEPEFRRPKPLFKLARLMIDHGLDVNEVATYAVREDRLRLFRVGGLSEKSNLDSAAFNRSMSADAATPYPLDKCVRN